MNLDRIYKFIGREVYLEEVARELCMAAQELHPTVVGALRLTCSDECEQECVHAFQRGFVNHLLPELKFAQQSPFRLANPGARYEWGSLPIAEEHFATEASRTGFKLMVVKLNAHVAVEEAEEGLSFGRRERYGDAASAYCGALNALLTNGELPCVHDLREAFTSDGLDRVRILREEVDPELRALLAAIVSVRIQARHAVMDIQNHRPSTPTVWWVLACVTLNREGRDTELVCGLYLADERREKCHLHYRGVGDDPRRYVLGVDHGRLCLSDDQVAEARPARDHRKLVLDTWEAQRSELLRDERVGAAVTQAHARSLAGGDAMVHRTLKALLPLLMEVAPVPAAVLLFAHGISGIHHAHRVHRLVRDMDDHHEARTVIAEFERRLDDLPAADVRAVLELLREHYG